MELLFRKNGKACHCASCGKTFSKGECEAVKFDGNTVGAICAECFSGNLPIGKPAWKQVITDLQTVNAKSTRNHDLQVICDNPFTAIECFIQFGGIVERAETGNILVTVRDQKACYKLGHLFSADTNRMKDGYKMIFVNGVPVDTLDNYHKVVKVGQ